MGIVLILSIVFGPAPYTPPEHKPAPAVAHRDPKPANVRHELPSCEDLDDEDDDEHEDGIDCDD